MRPTAKQVRVPLNCTILPETKELLTGIQNSTRESQGDIVDRAVALLTTGEELPVPVRKPTRKDIAMAARAAADLTARQAERSDIDYADLDSVPTTHIAADKRPLKPVAQQASIIKWRQTRRPLLKPKERK